MKKIIIAIVAVVIAAAVAVGGYFIFSDKSEPEQVELTVIKNDFTLNDTLLNSPIKNPDRYKKRLVENYGLTEEKADEFYAAPETWLTFEQIITIKNASDEHLTVYGYEVKDNGKNGIYIKFKDGEKIYDKDGNDLYPEIRDKGNEQNMAEAMRYMDLICSYDPLYITSSFNSGELIISYLLFAQNRLADIRDSIRI